MKSEPLNDESLMPYGRFENCKMVDIPVDYLLKLYSTLALLKYRMKPLERQVFNYVKENYQDLQDEFNAFNKYRKTI